MPRGHRAGASRCASVSCASVSCASVFSDSRPCGRRVLAVWPLESGRVASGLSPYGVSSFYTPRLGVRARGRMVSNLTPVRTLQPVTGALGGDLGGLAAAVYPIGLCLSPCLPLPLGAVPAFEPRRQGGRECAVRYWIQHALRWACTGTGSSSLAGPPECTRT